MNFLRNIVLSLVLFSVIGSTLMVPLIYVDFEVRRDYISKVLCVERNNPITICKGSCYLSTKLEKALEHEQKQKTANSINEIVFFLSENSLLLPLDDTTFPEHDFVITDQILNGRERVLGIFRPPQG